MPRARRQLPPPDPALRQRALAALALGALSLIGLMLGLGNLQRGIYVAILTLLFAVGAIWLGVTATRKARRSGTARPRWAVGGVVLGGLGSVSGSLIAAYIVGYLETATAYLIAPTLRPIPSLILLVLVVYVRPQGLLGRR